MENLKRLSTRQSEVINEIYGTEVYARELVIKGAASIENSGFQDIGRQMTTPWPKPSTPKTTFLYLTNLHLILDNLSYMSHLSLPLLESLRTTQSSVDHEMERLPPVLRTLSSCISMQMYPSYILSSPSSYSLHCKSLALSQESSWVWYWRRH